MRKRNSPNKASLLPSSYAPLLADLKARVRAAQVRAAVSVNRELILLYWHIGREILRTQKAEGWGREGRRAVGKGFGGGVPGNEWFFCAKPTSHARFLRSVGASRNCATARCTIGRSNFVTACDKISKSKGRGDRSANFITARDKIGRPTRTAGAAALEHESHFTPQAQRPRHTPLVCAQSIGEQMR